MNGTDLPAKSGQTSDGELVRSSLAGSRESFEELVARHTRLVYGVIYYKIGRCPEEDDLVQQVFLEAWKSLPKLKEPHRFGNWLYGITINICLAWLRKKKKENLASREINNPEIQPAAKNNSGPDESDSLRETVRQALNSLKPEYREVIYLYHFERKSYQEIADFIGASTALINKRLTEARKQLRAWFHKETIE